MRRFFLSCGSSVMYEYKDIPVGMSRVTVCAFGPEDAQTRKVLNWSLRLFRPEIEPKDRKALITALGSELLSAKVHQAFAPRVDAMSAHVVGQEELTERFHLGSGITLYRNSNVPADGVFLRPSQAFVMSGAGCPVIVASGGTHFVVAHAGRDSLVDRQAVEERGRRREYLSVVHAVVHAFSMRGVPADGVAMGMLFAIPRESFEHHPEHPVYGDYNRELVAFLERRYDASIIRRNGTAYLDLQALFIAQARRVGVRRPWVLHPLQDHPDLAHTRDGMGSAQRNLIIVKRTR